ncbi:MAG: DNA/RNA non-specific endonuclease [Bacteroidales bacterium]|jgi:endonuclease G|nr:DNA/RNA non-specific endonuclease [Bacteroidales bacterium]
MKNKLAFTLLFLFIGFYSFSQDKELENILERIQKIDKEKDSLLLVAEDLKLTRLKENLINYGLPELEEGEELICHSAFCLVFDDNHKLAKWVAHVISRDIAAGGVTRTNDFRKDPLIKNGSSEEADFFLKIKGEDDKIKYDGFGYDRGHLAPSADFRWSEKALSESYFYSNMTPQLPDFNRKKWAEIENLLRDYVCNNPEKDLYVVTAPVLHDELPRQPRSKNKISIPEYHYKIAVEPESKIGIAFLVSQQDLAYPIESYVVSIDSVESVTGINFFPGLQEEDEILIESVSDISLWRSGKNKNDVAPIPKDKLPKNYYNTVEARQFFDYPKDVTICGKVVGTTKSRNGHVFLNLDKSFPNQIFSVTIWKSNLSNFSYNPESFLLYKTICVKGTVNEYEGVPAIYPDNEKNITLFD